MSLTSVDLPEPETPVTATNRPSGNATSTSRRLLADAPLTVTSWPRVRLRRCAGSGISLRPVRYAPVSDSSLASSSSTGPETTTWPPCSPARGPMSTTQSAARMVSSSCSTTISVLPRSRSRSSVSSSRWLSRWCSPMDGSSSTYRTPTRPEPIWVASRIRCASPPARVADARSSDQVVQADVEQEPQPGVDLLEDPAGDLHVPVGQLQGEQHLGQLADRQRAVVGDRPAVHLDRQRDRLEPGALAGRARHLAHVARRTAPGWSRSRPRSAAARCTGSRPRSWCSTSAPGRTGSCTGRAPARRSRAAAPCAPPRAAAPTACRC